jgi:hypothetical protein
MLWATCSSSVRVHSQLGQRGVEGSEGVLSRLVGADVLGGDDAAKSPCSRLLLPAKPSRCTLDRMISWECLASRARASVESGNAGQSGTEFASRCAQSSPTGRPGLFPVRRNALASTSRVERHGGVARRPPRCWCRRAAAVHLSGRVAVRVPKAGPSSIRSQDRDESTRLPSPSGHANRSSGVPACVVGATGARTFQRAGGTPQREAPDTNARSFSMVIGDVACCSRRRRNSGRHAAAFAASGAPICQWH